MTRLLSTPLLSRLVLKKVQRKREAQNQRRINCSGPQLHADHEYTQHVILTFLNARLYLPSAKMVKLCFLLNVFVLPLFAGIVSAARTGNQPPARDITPVSLHGNIQATSSRLRFEAKHDAKFCTSSAPLSTGSRCDTTCLLEADCR